MKALNLFLGVFLLLLCMPQARAVNSTSSPKDKVLNSAIYTLYGVPFHTDKKFAVADLLDLSAREFSNSYATPLTWKQKLAYRMARKEYRYRMSRGDYDISHMPAHRTDFSFLAFLLGFFLSLLGLLIAWIFMGRRGAISALYGLLFSAILFVVGYRIRR